MLTVKANADMRSSYTVHRIFGICSTSPNTLNSEDIGYCVDVYAALGVHCSQKFLVSS